MVGRSRWAVVSSIRWMIVVGVMALACGGEDSAETGSASVSPEGLVHLMGSAEDFVVLDVRSRDEYLAGHIAGSVNIPHREIAYRLEELDAYRDKRVVVYCVVGGRAGLAENALRDAGFAHVFDLTGHMAVWDSLGYPIERADSN